MLGAQALPVDVNGLWADEPCTALHDGDAIRVEAGGITLIQVAHVLVAVALQGGPVMRMGSDGEAVVGRILQCMRDMARVPHDLFRHAADVHASAAQPPALDQHAARAVLGRAIGDGHAAAAPADSEKIEWFEHRLSSLRPKSREFAGHGVIPQDMFLRLFTQFREQSIIP